MLFSATLDNAVDVLVRNYQNNPVRCEVAPPANEEDRNAHHFVNRSKRPAKYLEMGTNVPGDTAFYPDDDLFIMWGEEGMAYTHKDGRKY